MIRPKLLDLFCGAGGAAMGYYRVGFDVVGVDINPMPRYPFEFHQGDALEYCREHGAEFDAIHVSPPCQGYSAARGLTNKKYPMLIVETRIALLSTGRAYVIENVVGAPLLNPTLLCGVMFDLRTYRHRLFETSFDMPLLLHMTHGATNTKLSGPTKERRGYMANVVGHPQYAGAAIDNRIAMGINWMSNDELSEAIPPAYTEFIGTHLLKVIGT